MKRRSFLKLSSLAGGGLVMAGQWPNKVLSAPMNGHWQPNFWIKMTPSNEVTFICTQLEMGQGTSTGLSQVLADELGARWEDLRIEFAPGDQKYENLQDTGGSNGLATLWTPLRKAAASTRDALLRAAADRWGIDPSQCYAEESFVRNDKGDQLSFGELSTAAALLKINDKVPLKQRKEYRYIGKSLSGHRQQQVVRGRETFSIDLKLPDMVYAVVERSPVVGGSARVVYEGDALKVPGVVKVFYYSGTEQLPNVFKGGARAGVVVVAQSTWSAMQARKKLKIEWDDGPNEKSGSDVVRHHFEGQIAQNSERDNTRGNPQGEFETSDDVHDYNYLIQHQANACMEPQNAIAHYQDNRVEVWAGTQAPQGNQARIADLLGWEPEQVKVNAYPCGGAFGRKYYNDYIEEAVLISKEVGRPVKLMWTREDTIRTDRYHDLRVENWKGKLANGKMIAIDYKGHQTDSNGWRPFPYDIPHMGYTRLKSKQPYLNLFTSWRSVYAHHWQFGLETFMDEMAINAGQDPLDFRLAHLNEAKVIEQKSKGSREDLHPGRLQTVLQLAAEKANWGKSMDSGCGQGIAGCSYNTSYCALVAEVTVTEEGYRVDKVVAAIDCGFAINPSQVSSQVEGSILWGMSSVQSKIDIEQGRTLQSNFHDYPLPRIDQSPEIEVHIVENDFAPSGVGEPAVPVTAPAILNAIYAATGKRLRKIPVLKEDLV